MRHNARPFLLVQAVAVALAAAYYLVPGASAALAGVARLKRGGGLPLAALCNAVAGAILPELARVATGRKRTGPDEMGFQILFFATLGVYVDLLYRGLGIVWGDGADVATVGKKVLFDQLVSSPLVTIPFSTFAFVWKDSGLSLARTRNAFRAGAAFSSGTCRPWSPAGASGHPCSSRSTRCPAISSSPSSSPRRRPGRSCSFT